jgi:UDP-3-O-[3-hydroxymyristoyl] glucosamine N-acyltransferase
MTIQEVADLVSGKLSGNSDATVSGVADVRTAEKGELAFVETGRGLVESNASALIVGDDYPHDSKQTTIRVGDPKLAFAKAAEAIALPIRHPAEVHSTAVIATSAKVDNDVFIGPYCTIGERAVVAAGTQVFSGVSIGDDAEIGKNCIIHANVVIESRCKVGDDVILHAGVVIGADGFGYVRDQDRYVKFPQIGTVVIEDAVEIGANTCIDRGALGETRIGEGTKIDNLVQVGHNVQVGKRVVIAAQTGISGSTVIEDDCIIGGQVGMGDHAVVKSGAVIGSQAGILPGKIVRPGVWWGTPVQPLDEFKRQNAHLKGIARLKQELKALKEKIEGGNDQG